MYCEPEVLEELAVFMSQAQTGQEVILVYFPRKSKLKSNKHEMKQALKAWPANLFLSWNAKNADLVFGRTQKCNLVANLSLSARSRVWQNIESSSFLLWSFQLLIWIQPCLQWLIGDFQFPFFLIFSAGTFIRVRVGTYELSIFGLRVCQICKFWYYKAY